MLYAYIFSGLPGVGKTTLAKLLTKSIKNTAYYRIDSIEYFLKKEYYNELTKQDYELTYYLAKENLELSNNIIIDCCNPINESRELLNKLSEISLIKVVNIEIICTNQQAHKKRIEARFKMNKDKYPSWQSVVDKDYQAWDQEVITIDTANKNEEDSLKQLMSMLNI